MALRSDKRERVAHPDGYGKRTGDCGDTVEMFLTIRDDRVNTVSFDINGCLNQLLALEVDLTEMTIRSPNLEDVFLELTGRQLRE